MYLLFFEPIKALLIFSIAPIIGALLGYIIAMQLKAKGKARENERFLRVRQGIVTGLLIDIPILIYILGAYCCM